MIRLGAFGEAIRIEKIKYTKKEGKTKEGCPIAKWIIRRSNKKEQLLVLIKHRKGHKCNATFIIVAIVVWEAIDEQFAHYLYDLITYKTFHFGIQTKRRCAQNEK